MTAPHHHQQELLLLLLRHDIQVVSRLLVSESWITALLPSSAVVCISDVV
jgi:hypothetical protein